jgi:hypothetical protein
MTPPVDGVQAARGVTIARDQLQTAMSPEQ